MERWKESQLKQLSCATEIDTAYRISLGFAKNIGFKFFAFSTTYPTKSNAFNTVQLNNYPADWNTEYEQKKLSALDPVVAHCNHSMLPVLWSEELFFKVPWLWEALEQYGLQHGWSQSFHDEESGLCSILSLARSHCPITAFELYENLGFSVFMGRHLHTLIAQTLPSKPAKPPIPHLSVREIDVLKLAADGKTADESARILNLSSRTIQFHLRNAMEKFEVHNKISAVIAAAKAGYLNSHAIR
ncbi:LuxR family transcriptional regulator [Pseudomonas sp. ANT_H12B]|uniref:helix-turn-helix transcriptional regulator n=1 Tax=Pseudomonas sp. ANT_H12B TaxID=2597348 RepID=UPI0011EF78C9|nr:LuxR family transcriptional regulator [Pseudomonas sp. ANT_H12B]KAA0969966.1 LuxR family transcriptional regulator [Pseudomonas sp. ANT_H12B]